MLWQFLKRFKNPSKNQEQGNDEQYGDAEKQKYLDPEKVFDILQSEPSIYSIQTITVKVQTWVNVVLNALSINWLFGKDIGKVTFKDLPEDATPETCKKDSDAISSQKMNERFSEEEQHGSSSYHSLYTSPAPHQGQVPPSQTTNASAPLIAASGGCT